MATLRAALAEIFAAKDATVNANMSDVIGRKDDASRSSVGTTYSLMANMKGALVYLAGMSTTTTKIDGAAVNGISGVVDSLAYKVDVLNYHHHSFEYWFGYASGNLLRGGLTAFQVACGNGAFSTEKVLYTGTGIGGAYFDFNQIRVSAVGTIIRMCWLEWYYGTKSVGIAATTQDAGDTVTKNSHGLANGTKIMFTSIVSTTGIDVSTVYYVVNQAANTFQVATTLGGAALPLTTNGTVNYHTLTQTILAEAYISRQSTTPDAVITPMNAFRIPSTSIVWCRALASGGANTVDFFIGVHTYSA